LLLAVLAPLDSAASPLSEPGGSVIAPPAFSGALLIERSLEELATLADRIVVADVTTVTPHKVSGDIVTDVSLNVRGTLKGTASATLVLTLPGGNLGTEGREVSGVPNFLRGERVLLFLTEQPTLSVTGLWQGKYTLLGDQAQQAELGSSQPIAQLQARLSAALARPVEIGPGNQLVVPQFSAELQMVPGRHAGSLRSQRGQPRQWRPDRQCHAAARLRHVERLGFAS
jgi:hypothetical protein